MGLFFVYLISPLLVQLFQKVSHTRQALDEPFNPSNACLRSRFYIGVAIFVIPSLFCALAPRNIARRIDPNAYTIAGLSITQSNQLVGPINQNGSIKQSFVAENDNLFRVNVKLATYARKNNCHVTLTLLDEANLPIATQKMDGETMTDNTFYKFKFKSIEHSKGKLYSIEIKSDGTVENSISAWKSNADVYLPGKLYLNGKVDTGDLNIELFYN
jgi:hypothetical protein